MSVIIDRGRGSEIAGTRITIYNVLDYSRHGHHHTYIAAILRISSAEVLAALKYIEEHHDEVMADYQEILDRAKRGNPPEVRAKLKQSRQKLLALKKQLRKKSQKSRNAEPKHARNSVRR